MADDLCILFAYHRCDALTWHHYETLLRSNAGHRIIPITDDVPDHLPGSIDVHSFPDPWPAADPWRRCDTMLYRWFLHRTASAKRYLLLEYDCLCTVDAADAYRGVWDADVAARDVYLPGQGRDTRWGEDIRQEWSHFDEIDRLPPEDRPFAAGLVPMAGLLFSHRGLERIVDHTTRNDVFCELRIGTAARKAGLRPIAFPLALRRTIRWDPHPAVPREPGIYHAIKSLPSASIWRRLWRT
jgi:hypothetical protein